MKGTLASRLEAVPGAFADAVSGVPDALLRARPAEGEWSAAEVLGHMVDKLRTWTQRVARAADAAAVDVRGYDQDAIVLELDYRHAVVPLLLEEIAEAAARFAAVVSRLPDEAGGHVLRHPEYGSMTVHEAVEVALRSSDEHLEQLLTAIGAARRRG